MITEIILLIILYFIFSWSVAWIKYFNKLDKRFGNSVWRWSYDYPVKGKRDISILDDKNFVILRRQRNKAITIIQKNIFRIDIIYTIFTAVPYAKISDAP